MQDQRGNLDEGHVPAPRNPDDEAYPAGTYASGSVVSDADRDGLADRDDVEIVDHDQALADEQASEEHTAGDATGDEVEAAEVVEAEEEAHEENEARGDGDFVPADVDPPADERDEVETAVAEEADDRAWAADHATQLRAGSLTDADADVTDADVTDADVTDADVTETDVTETDADAEDRDETVVDSGPVATSEALEGGEALDAGDVVAVPVPDQAAYADTDTDTDAGTGTDAGTDTGTGTGVSAAGQDLRPGAVEAVPVGALWADGAAEGLRERWRELQLRFIDDPQSVAGEADQLVAEAVSTVTGALESQRAQLSAWQGDGGGDTERLRAAVRQYRDFLNRLLDL